jgi:hypothetical protein
MGAEDFAYMLREKPGCYVWLGNGPGSGGCTLHNPHYDFNDAILPLGVSYWVAPGRDLAGSEPGDGEALIRHGSRKAGRQGRFFVTLTE